MTELLRGQTALVTGAAAGIGAAITRGLLAAGANIVAIDVMPVAVDELQAFASGEGQKIHAYHCDATDADEIRDVCRMAERDNGPISILINNVGGSGSKKIDQVEDMSDEVWDFVLSLNLGSIMRFCRALVPAMKRNRYGRIVNLSSNLKNGVFGAKGVPGARLPYIAAKSAIVGMTKQLAKDLGPYGITVNAIAPGFTLPGEDARVTRHFRSLPAADQQRMTSGIPLGRPANGQDMANAVCFFASPASDYVNGEILAVAGGSDQ